MTGLPPAADREDWLRSATRWGIATVLVAGGALRLLHLDADPVYPAWVGYITDEGRWVAHARELALFEQITSVGWLLHLLLAPLFQAATYVVFELAGVSILSSRLVVAVSGVALLFLAWALLRRLAAPVTLFVTLAMLALSVDLVALSRVAIPEMPALVLELCVYALLVGEDRSPKRLFAAGGVLFLTVAVKATTLPMLPIFSAVALARPIESTKPGPGRLSALALFWAGFVLPAAGGVLVLFWCCRQRADAIGANLAMLPKFVRIADLFEAANFLFEGAVAPAINIAGIGLCLATVGALASAVSGGAGRPRRHFALAMTWCLGHGALILMLGYFPDRYKVHVLVPMAIAMAAGLTLHATVGQDALDRWLATGAGWPRRLALLALALPTAVWWAPALTALAVGIGMDPGRLRVRAAALAVGLACTLWVLARRVRAGGGSWPFFAFPVAGALVWLGVSVSGSGAARFWPTTDPADHAFWPVGSGLAVAITALAMALERRGGVVRRRALISVAALAYAGLLAARVVPASLNPHYSIREASERLGALLGGSGAVVAAVGSEGLFNNNALPYFTVPAGRWPRPRPEFVVVAFGSGNLDAVLTREYDLLASYHLVVSPEYDRRRRPAGQSGEVVHVYRRRPTVETGIPVTPPRRYRGQPWREGGYPRRGRGLAFRGNAEPAVWYGVRRGPHPSRRSRARRSRPCSRCVPPDGGRASGDPSEPPERRRAARPGPTVQMPECRLSGPA